VNCYHTMAFRFVNPRMLTSLYLARDNQAFTSYALDACIMQVTYLRCKGFIRKGDAMAIAQTETPKVNDKREIFGWAMYDWANSAFSTTVGTVFLAPYVASLAKTVAECWVRCLSCPSWAPLPIIPTAGSS
jgi:hypothetical protein